MNLRFIHKLFSGRCSLRFFSQLFGRKVVMPFVSCRHPFRSYIVTLKRNIATAALGLARLLLSSRQKKNNNWFALAVFSIYYKDFSKNIKMPQLHTVSSISCSLFPHFFFFLSAWSGSPFVPVRSSGWDRGIKVWLRLSRWIWVDGETQVSAFPAVFVWHICCDIPTTAQAWFWPDRELSLSVNLIHQLTMDPTGQCMPGFGPPQSTYIEMYTI